MAAFFILIIELLFYDHEIYHMYRSQKCYWNFIIMESFKQLFRWLNHLLVTQVEVCFSKIKIGRVPNTVKKLRTFCTNQSFSSNTSDTTKPLSSSLPDTCYSTAQLPTLCLQPPWTISWDLIVTKVHLQFCFRHSAIFRLLLCLQDPGPICPQPIYSDCACFCILKKWWYLF